MYFTRNNYLDGKKGKDGNKITFNQIIQSQKNEKWTNVTELPLIVILQYSTSRTKPDGKTLYFASDMPVIRTV
jgi:hypothetical protein